MVSTGPPPARPPSGSAPAPPLPPPAAASRPSWAAPAAGRRRPRPPAAGRRRPHAHAHGHAETGVPKDCIERGTTNKGWPMKVCPDMGPTFSRHGGIKRHQNKNGKLPSMLETVPYLTSGSLQRMQRTVTQFDVWEALPC